MYKTIRDIKAVNKHFYLAAEDIKKDKNIENKADLLEKNEEKRQIAVALFKKRSGCLTVWPTPDNQWVF